jgi:hypothetical protein
VDRNVEPALFNAIGVSWGGDGTPNFFLPDLKGRFLRGVDRAQDGTEPNPARDPDRGGRESIIPPSSPLNPGNSGNAVGSIQSDGFASHHHGITDPGHSHALSNRIIGDIMGGFGLIDAGDHGKSGSIHDLGITATSGAGTGIAGTGSSGGAESRPKNAYVYWIIRARD